MAAAGGRAQAKGKKARSREAIARERGREPESTRRVVPFNGRRLVSQAGKWLQSTAHLTQVVSSRNESGAWTRP